MKDHSGTARLRNLALLGVLTALSATSCFGKLAMGANQSLEPKLIIPGAVMNQEVTIEGDGLLGNAIRQSISQSSPTPSTLTSGSPWQVRDNSDSTTVKIRMFRTIDLPIGTTDLSDPNGVSSGGVTVQVADFVVARRFVVSMRAKPTVGSSTGTTSSPVSQQAAQAALAAVTLDYSLVMPGLIQSTNGVPSDSGRLIWHLKLDSSTEQVLQAESLFIDWPRLLLILVLVVALVAARKVTKSRNAANDAARAEIVNTL